jgi:Mg2+-importing ATPase
VGLTPQLLPAIVTITLAQGARRMASKQVVVRRLVAIEDFGGMQILCTDKTGTLTQGKVHVRAGFDWAGRESQQVLRLAHLNAVLQAGFDNPIDSAIRADLSFDCSNVQKLDEVPYDFTRRRLSVLARESDGITTLVMKGAVPEVIAVCSMLEDQDGTTHPLSTRQERIERLARELGASGLRCLAVAYRRMEGSARTSRQDERDMVFVGILALSDPLKPDIRATVDRLRSLGVRVKIITGDNALVAAPIAQEVALDPTRMMVGAELRKLTDDALRRRVTEVDVFAEVDPNQKERIILALRKGGVSVGYLGDGINDAAALHAADVGISVDTAVDVTRGAADIVLLRKDLDVLAQGIEEGRRAFANTLKYVFMTTSANFGNMFSMAGASMITSFLPMLPKQILLLNLLTDLPAMAIATDRLDPELVARPRRWDVRHIRNFMITFGLVSSAFDYLTFFLLLLLAVPVAQFRAGWFIESALSEIFLLIVIRTRRTFFRSPPSRALLAASIAVGVLSLTIPYLPGAHLLGFAPPGPLTLTAVLTVAFLLLLASEGAKRFFLAHESRPG